jgi:hypothetical protein
MAPKKSDEWRAIGLTALLGITALAGLAWLMGMFSPN